MESEGSRVKIPKKIFSPPKEKPKRKNKARKDSDSKILESKPAEDVAITNNNPETVFTEKAEMTQYVYKLQHELNVVNKELQFEQKKYKDFITSISNFLKVDEDTFADHEECNQLLGIKDADHLEETSNFEKLFKKCRYDLNEKSEILVEHEHAGHRGRGHKGSKDFTSSKSKGKAKDGDAEDLGADKNADQNKKNKKRKASLVEEEGENKVKKPKKNKEKTSTSHIQDSGTAEVEPIVLDEEKEQENDVDNKIRKTEDIINQYEGLAHHNSGLKNYDREEETSFLPQTGLDPSQLYSQQFLPGNNGLENFTIPALAGDSNDHNRAEQLSMQDLLSMGVAPSQQDLLNYYKRSFQQ